MYGGGETGGSTTENYGTGGFGGTQTGVSNASWQTTSQPTSTTTNAGAYAGFGFGGNGITANNGNGGAGGGGWYGGSGSMPDSSGDDDRGGGGGSGFVWTGANAPTGFGLTEAYYLKNAETTAGSQSFASPSGTAETGHSGDGYVRITPLPPPVTYTITVLAGDNGTAAGGGTFEEGTQVTVTAAPDSGYRLTGWYENGVKVSGSKDYTFIVSGNRTLTATFEIKPTSRLPEGYTEVEYINNPNSGRINSFGVTNTELQNIKVEMKIDITGADLTKITNFFSCSVYTNSHKSYIGNSIQLTTEKKFRYYNYDDQYAASTSIDVQIPIPDGVNTLTFDAVNKVLKVNDTEEEIRIKFYSPNVVVDLPFFTGVTNKQQSSGAYQQTYSGSYYTGRVYEIKVYSSGNLIRHFIPCIDPQNSVGFYEMINNDFVASSNNEVFVAGPAV